jgi:two-component sensor histidine kinase
MLSTAELRRRPSRAPDYEAENRALLTLAQEMAVSPEGILQKLADIALSLCHAHSAGLSLLEDGDLKRRFHWRAIAGQWSPHVNGGTPREFGPCGTVLDRNVAMICSHPERDFPYWADVKPVLEEGLLIPFYIKGEALGTIWVVAHDESRRFDSEDLRVMTNLGTFAAAAYQTMLFLNAADKREEQISILAREAEHRTKNVLATVQAIVHLSHSDTPNGLKHAIEGRVKALANVNTLFVQSRWTGAELHNLVTQELSPYFQDGETRARIEGPKLLLEASRAQTIAVTLHELATNAAKYGALSVPNGQIQVEWSRGADGQLVLRWTETGGPPVKPPTLRGFGTRVMESMIRGHYGDMRFDWHAKGLVCEITILA